ncbi:MAG: ABC transporter ATP-binding protein, partial [Arenicella sp.]|nr:ABC transporter ATP-binding protein [Arenicella sp.]
VIGHNGAGKSTLLKVLSRITPPTTGQVQVRGQVSSLLEVGTGFHPELTGRENIFFNGSILGMTREQIRQRFDEIVAFAEVEKFIDTPVKRYSSGMYVRLAFSVAAHLDSDVLIVDEVLAVGDQRFQDRSLGKLDDLGDQGRTVLFVSHNLSMITRLCSQVMLLEQGSLLGMGPVSEITALYASRRHSDSGDGFKGVSGVMKKDVDFLSLTVNEVTNMPEVVVSAADAIQIHFRFHLKRDVAQGGCTLSLVKNGQVIVSQHDCLEPCSMDSGHYESVFRFDDRLLSPGRYGVSIGLFDQTNGEWAWAVEQVYIVIPEIWLPDYQPNNNMGIINLKESGTRRMLAESS